MEVQILHGGREAELGELEQPGEAAIGARGALAFQEQGEAIFEGEAVEIGLASLLVEGVGHPGEPQLVEPVKRLLEEHRGLLRWG